MRSPYDNPQSSNLLAASIPLVVRAQGLNTLTQEAFKTLVKTMNNPADPCTIDEAITYTRSLHPAADHDALFPAYEALFLYVKAKQALSQALDDQDTKTILHLLESFGKMEGYKPAKDEVEQKEVIITITKQT